MAEEKKVQNIEEIPDVEDPGLYVKFGKPYNFEGEKIADVDLSGLENVTAKTMIKASKTLATSGDVQLLPENSLHYAIILAADCTKWPIEFYEQLRPNDAIKIKNAVTNFLYGEESE